METACLTETLEGVDFGAAGLGVVGHHIVKVAIMSSANEKVIEERSDSVD